MHLKLAGIELQSVDEEKDLGDWTYCCLDIIMKTTSCPFLQ